MRRARIGERNFDHVDAEKRGSLVTRRIAVAEGQFFGFTNRTRARIVHDEAVGALRDDGMGVAATAGLHLTDLARAGDVGSVEDAQTAKALLAHPFGHALQSAVDATARFLHAHDQDIARNGYVALPAGTHHRAEQFRHAVLAQAIGVEPVVVTGHHQIARKGHIGVGKGQHPATLCKPGLLFFLRFVCARIGTGHGVARMARVILCGGGCVPGLTFFCLVIVDAG